MPNPNPPPPNPPSPAPAPAPAPAGGGGTATATAKPPTLNDLLDALGLKSDKQPWPLILADLQPADRVIDVDRMAIDAVDKDRWRNRLKSEELALADRFITSLGVLFQNVDEPDEKRGLDKSKIQAEIDAIDGMVARQLDEVLHHPTFQRLEATWRGLYDLASNVNFRDNVMLDILDCTWRELQDDLVGNVGDMCGGALFKKVYVAEYDQYGGRPFGVLLGLFELGGSAPEMEWLTLMGRVANASHAPFLTSVGPSFFHCKTITELAAIRDLSAHMDHPRFSKWHALRDSPEAAYIGLALPRYILRPPYDPETNPSTLPIRYSEKIRNGEAVEDQDYLWGNSAVLVAKNLVRSFEQAGWCQSIRGPEGGGVVRGLPVHTFNVRGEEEIKVPVEFQVPDFRELDFARCGLMPLVYRKGTGDACFFSAQSIKRPKRFMDPKDQENSQLVTNLAYTFSITRLAHYIKSIMRDKIGTTADAPYIQTLLGDWLMRFVTEVSNPDDLTLRAYPFKAATIVVAEQEGEIGWYDCKLAVKPHIQFEGMDVELRLEARL